MARRSKQEATKQKTTKQQNVVADSFSAIDVEKGALWGKQLKTQMSAPTRN